MRRLTWLARRAARRTGAEADVVGGAQCDGGLGIDSWECRPSSQNSATPSSNSDMTPRRARDLATALAPSCAATLKQHWSYALMASMVPSTRRMGARCTACLGSGALSSKSARGGPMYSIGMRGSSGEMGWNGPYEIDTGEGSAGTGC